MMLMSKSYLADPECVNCDERLANLGMDYESCEFKNERGQCFCSVDCLHDAENEEWENRAYSNIPPDYND